MSGRDAFKILTVYENASDYPGKFVVRAALITGDGPRMMPIPIVVADTLEAARAAIAEHDPGLIRMHRMPDDDPVIVEVWI